MENVNKQKKLFKIVGITVFFIFLLSAIILLILPSLLPTDQILRMANSQIPGKIDAESVKLSWFGKQEIEQFKLYDPDGNVVLSMDKASLNSLSGLLLHGWTSHFQLEVTGLQGNILRSAEGGSNLHQALGIDAGNEALPPLEIRLFDVDLHLHMGSQSNPLKIDFSGKFESNHNQGSIELKAEGSAPENLHLFVAKVQGFPIDLLEQLVSIKNPQLGKALRAALGDTLDLELNHHERQGVSLIQLDAKTSLMTAEFYGHLSAEGLSLATPGKITLKAIPALLTTLLPEIALRKSTPLEIVIDQFKIPYASALTLSQAEIQAHMNVDNVVASTFTLHDARATLAKMPNDPLFNLTLKGYVDYNTRTSKVDLAISMDDALDRLHVQGKIDPFTLKNGIVLQNLGLDAEIRSLKAGQFNLTANLTPQDNPSLSNLLGAVTELKAAGGFKLAPWSVEQLQGRVKNSYGVMDFNGKIDQSPSLHLSLKGRLNHPQATQLLGSTFEAQIDANLSENGGIMIAAAGDQWAGNAHLTAGDFLTLQSPALIHYKLTPKRFEAINKRLSLQNTAAVTLNLTSLKLPLNSPNGKGAFKADLKVDQFKARDFATDQFIHFENLSADLLSQDIARQINFNLHTDQKDKQGRKSDLVLKGEVDNALTANYKLNTVDMSMNIQTHAKQLPASLICELVNLEKPVRIKMEALLGPILDADVEVQLKKMNGPLKLFLQGANGQLQMHALINNGFLTLNEPFAAEVAASPQLGESVMQDLVPVLSGMISSEERLQIIIDPEGFSCPIDLKSLDQIQVGMMTVNLGRVYFSNQGQLGKILSVFKAKPQDVISVWFTPIYLSMQAGQINLQRFDMLAMEAFPLAAWGTIDLPGDYINMVIGLSGKSLQSAVGLPTFDKNYIMQFPYRGRIGKASVDRTKAAARIAALAASMTATPQGLALGAVIGLASGSLTEEKAPSPTTQPFPWQEQNGNTGDSPPDEQKKRSKNPLKLIKKGAENLLETFLR